MTHIQVHLNLARKWRSKQFDEVIGQELSLRILQNSLYLNQFFPVYLFSGQRGCGKTTTARLFAAAVNCQNLELFQKQPKVQKIPCLTCDSCAAMRSANHPDFIEIDAASHTGVDNVRHIIESASLLPVLGRKKIYLIDEAHMLSKAAFNAFLKILEEPPASVLFMLATTDPHKIIETVRSRCFQLFFTSIPVESVVKHLEHICTEEAIAFDIPALHLIACETGGSARDALNLLEQVRFSHAKVTADAVVKVLGHMPEKLFLDILEYTIQGDLHSLMHSLRTCSFENYVPLSVWTRLTHALRSILFMKQGLADTGTFENKRRLTALAHNVSAIQVIGYLQHTYSYEMLLLKSTVPHTVLEMLFIDLCQKRAIVHKGPQEPVDMTHPRIIEPLEIAKEVVSKPVAQPTVASVVDSRWQAFVAQVSQLSDPLLQSIFKQAEFKSYDAQTREIVVLFAKEAMFFGEWLADTKSSWKPLLDTAFNASVELRPLFEGSKNETASPVRSATPSVMPTEKKVTQQNNAPGQQRPAYRTAAKSQTNDTKKETVVDVSDTQKWQKANLLMDAFGGSIIDVKEDQTDDHKEGQ